MCLGVPGKVVSIENDIAKVSIGGVMYDAALALADTVEPGQYVLVHAGFVLEVIDREEAEETLNTLREYTNLYTELEIGGER